MDKNQGTRNKINRLVAALEANTRALLDEVATLSDEEYDRQPSEKKWSVGQILMHLLTVEKMSLGYMKKKSLGIDTLKNSGPWEAFKMWLLIAYQHLPVRQKAPKIIVANTPAVVPLKELQTAWRLHHEELKAFISSVDNRNLKKKIYRHAIAGRLDVYQALRFFMEHFYHHYPQVKRILKK